MRDERDRQLVDTGVSWQRATRQLGELAVVPARQTLPYFADVLLDDVEVVQQPFAGRAYVDISVGGFRQPGMNVVQDLAGLIETRQQPGPTRRATSLYDLLSGRNLLGPFREMLGAQQLAADRTSEQLIGSAGAAGAESGQERR